MSVEPRLKCENIKTLNKWKKKIIMAKIFNLKGLCQRKENFLFVYLVKHVSEYSVLGHPFLLK